MAYRINGLLDIRFQGLNLNCGRYCLEAVMRFKHGTPYGADVVTPSQWDRTTRTRRCVYGPPRTAHTAAVQAHIARPGAIGFSPENHAADYGLVSFTKPPRAADWEQFLRDYGPIIVAGHIGAVRILPFQGAGHYVVVVGVNTDNEIEYYDPLRPWHALGGEPTTMKVKNFVKLAYDTIYVMAGG